MNDEADRPGIIDDLMKLSPELKQMIHDSKPKPEGELVTSESIQVWKHYMNEEVGTIYTACKDGKYPLTNDGAVYFGMEDEKHIFCKVNGVPNCRRPHLYLMKQHSPEQTPWGVYDDNMKLVHGPFADIGEAIEHIQSENYSVEGVWDAL